MRRSRICRRHWSEPDCAPVHRNLAKALLAVGDYERGWVEYPRMAVAMSAASGFPDQSHLLERRCAPRPDDPITRRAGIRRQLAVPPLRGPGGRGWGEYWSSPRPRSCNWPRCRRVDLAFTADTYTPVCHVHAPLLSLPAIFRTTIETIPADVPYLFVIGFSPR